MRSTCRRLCATSLRSSVSSSLNWNVSACALIISCYCTVVWVFRCSFSSLSWRMARSYCSRSGTEIISVRYSRSYLLEVVCKGHLRVENYSTFLKYLTWSISFLKSTSVIRNFRSLQYNYSFLNQIALGMPSTMRTVDSARKVDRE